MKVDKAKLELVMARKCMSLTDIVKTAGMPEASAKNVLYGRSVKPRTLGKVCKALNVDPSEIIIRED